MEDKHCGDCKFFGAPIGDEVHICENDRSIYKAAHALATGCTKFEKKEEGKNNAKQFLTGLSQFSGDPVMQLIMNVVR